jgi:hypothetical protein
VIRAFGAHCQKPTFSLPCAPATGYWVQQLPGGPC